MKTDDEARELLGHLERVGQALGVEIRYEPLGSEDDSVPTSSGLCVVRSQPKILIDSRLGPRGKAMALATALAEFDLSSVFVPPIVRQLLEEHRQDSPKSDGIKS